MKSTLLGRWRGLGLLSLALALVVPVVPAFGQSGGGSTIVTIDAPTDGQRVRTGEQVLIGGWAVDWAGPGTGVDAVHVFLDGPMGQGTRVGVAEYGSSRADVAEALGNSAFTNSGYNLNWTVPGLSPGRHTLFVYAQSLSAGWVAERVNVEAAGAPTPRPQAGPYGAGPYGAGPYGAGPYGGGGGGPYGAGPYGGGPYGGYGGYGGGPYGGGLYGGYGGGPYGGGPYGGAYGGPYGGFFPPYAPTFPFGSGAYTQTVTVIVPSSGSVALTWVAVPFALRYRIYQATAAAPLNFTVVQTIEQSTGILATNATVSGLTAGQTVYFQVRAVDANGQETVVLSSSGVSTFPGFGLLPPPTNIVVASTTATTASITWTAVPGATTYRVFVSSGGGPFVPAVMSSLTSTGATISGLVTATTYSVQVIAVDAFGNQSQPSAAVTFTTV